MGIEFFIFTGVATAATIAPVYKVRKALAKVFKIPYIGALVALGYGLGVSYILLTLFSFQSSIAGLANLLASIIFTIWLYFNR